jgi:hypothetical protein
MNLTILVLRTKEGKVTIGSKKKGTPLGASFFSSNSKILLLNLHRYGYGAGACSADTLNFNQTFFA